jgi:hypothetical protein
LQLLQLRVTFVDIGLQATGLAFGQLLEMRLSLSFAQFRVAQSLMNPIN